MKVVVGLGNPGEKYEKTRHNIGFMFLDFLLKENNSLWEFNKKFNLSVAYLNGVYYLKPLSFMNNSGLPLRSFLEYYKLIPKKMGIFPVKDYDFSEILTVVHDELDLDFGRVKNSINSSSAGHKGVQSIINHLRSKNFKRLRLGVGNDERKFIPTEKFVLSRFSANEIKKTEELFLSVDL